MTTTTLQVCVLDFGDYQSFLVAHYHLKKKERPAWSFSLWAKALGLKTPSSISKVIRGERHPGLQITESLVRYFRFTESEEKHFRKLIVESKLSRLNERKVGLSQNRDSER